MWAGLITLIYAAPVKVSAWRSGADGLFSLFDLGACPVPSSRLSALPPACLCRPGPC